MKFNLSFLSLFILILLIALTIFTISRYEILSKGEGWGMVAVIGTGGILLTGFIADLIIGNLVKNLKARLILRIVAALTYSALFISFLYS